MARRMIHLLPSAEQAQLLGEAESLLSTGCGWRALNGVGGFSWTTLRRFVEKARAVGGLPGAPGFGSGRPAAFIFTEEEESVARWHRLTKESLQVAIELFMEDARIEQDLRFALREHMERAWSEERRPSWPDSVRRAFHVTDEEKAQFRGGKIASHSGSVTRRGMTFIDTAGKEIPITPGMVWELDDYSTNQPFVWRCPQTGTLNLGRQVLAARDLASGAWLGFDLIGRERDAYRGEDIVRFLGRLFRAHGLPRFLRLERGSWESSFVHGLSEAVVAKKWGIEGWGGLDGLTQILHTFTSRGKGGIEGGFNVLQRYLSHSGRDVGRVRGEFAEAQKAWMRGNKEHIDPRELGFLTQAQSLELHEQAAKKINGKPQDRKALGEYVAPDDLIARHGWNTASLPEAEAWRLLPYRVPRIASQGMVTVNPGMGWPELTFALNGVDPEIHVETGHRILVAYDPLRPDLGARIANADASPKNRKSWGMGQILLEAAPHDGAAPQIDLSGKRHATLSRTRSAKAAAATSFRAIRSAGTEAVSTDGQGNVSLASTLNQPTPGQRPAATAATSEDTATEASAHPARRGSGASPRTQGRGSSASRMPTDPTKRAEHLAKLRAAVEADPSLY